METLETLSNYSHNSGYIREHGITQRDIDEINHSIHLIQMNRKKYTPIMGDIIQLMAPGDKEIKYMHGHLDTHIDPDDWRGGSICVKPYTSFVFHNGRELTGFSTSGGYWIRQLEKEMYKFIEKESLKIFCQFGHNGACGNGAVYFQAKVNTWKVIMEAVY